MPKLHKSWTKGHACGEIKMFLLQNMVQVVSWEYDVQWGYGKKPLD
jgi:hypothetical protein